MAKALAKGKESPPAHKRRKTSTEHSSKDEKVDEGIKAILYFYLFSYSTKEYEKTKTELKEETEEVGRVSFLTPIPTHAANTMMYYDPFLVPLDLEDEE